MCRNHMFYHDYPYDPNSPLSTKVRCLLVHQWNPSSSDTNGAEECVLFSEVSLFQRLKCMQEWY